MERHNVTSTYDQKYEDTLVINGFGYIHYKKFPAYSNLRNDHGANFSSSMTMPPHTKSYPYKKK